MSAIAGKKLLGLAGVLGLAAVLAGLFVVVRSELRGQRVQRPDRGLPSRGFRVGSG